MEIIKGMRDSMVFTSIDFTQEGGGIHHILIISRVSRTPTPPIKWEQRLFQEYHHHIQGLHIIKNISNGSTIYIFMTIRVPTPQKRGTKTLPLVCNTLWASYA